MTIDQNAGLQITGPGDAVAKEEPTVREPVVLSARINHTASILDFFRDVLRAAWITASLVGMPLFTLGACMWLWHRLGMTSRIHQALTWLNDYIGPLWPVLAGLSLLMATAIVLDISVQRGWQWGVRFVLLARSDGATISRSCLGILQYLQEIFPVLGVSGTVYAIMKFQLNIDPNLEQVDLISHLQLAFGKATTTTLWGAVGMMISYTALKLMTKEIKEAPDERKSS